MEVFGKIMIAVGLLVGLAIILGIAIAVISKKFTVKADPRQEEMLKMMPGANCGGCGYPGCAGLCEAVVKGEVSKIKTCKVISEDNAKKVVDYLNSTPDAEGKTLKVTL